MYGVVVCGMNEITAEAKAAAEKVYHPNSKYVIATFCKGYDSRNEEVARLSASFLDLAEASAKEVAKLRETNQALVDNAKGRKASEEAAVAEANKLRELNKDLSAIVQTLAGQPMAGVHKPEDLVYRMDCKLCGETDSATTCPSAPMPDVEQLAREALDDIKPFLKHQDIEGSVEESETHGVLLRLATQARALRQDELDAEWDKGFNDAEEKAEKARAPLVAAATIALEQYELLIQIVSDISAFKDVDWEQDEHIEAAKRLRRALTGTGEK